MSSIYKIEIQSDNFIDTAGHVCRGNIDFEDRLIKVAKHENPNMLKTFLHEVIHAVCSELELYEGEHDEAFVDRLAVGLVDTLIRNKLIKE